MLKKSTALQYRHAVSPDALSDEVCMHVISHVATEAGLILYVLCYLALSIVFNRYITELFSVGRWSGNAILEQNIDHNFQKSVEK